MTQASKGNQQIMDAEKALTDSFSPPSAAKVAHTQAMLTLALVREQRTANLIAWFCQPGWEPSPEVEDLILDALGLKKEDEK